MLKIKKYFSFKFKFQLFWKILLSLWAVFFVVFITNLVIIQINSDDIKFRPIPPHYLEQLKFRKKKLRYILNGKKRIPPKATKLLQDTYLLDRQGVDYLGKKIPETLSQLHHQVMYLQYSLLAFKKENHYVGGSDIKINQKNYKLYIHQKAPFFSQRYLGLLVHEFTRKMILITFFASFPFSLLIAWFFNRPIKRLRFASHDLIASLENRKELSAMTKRTDEFGDLAKDMNKLACHLSQLISSKNQLLGDVSHELRSPLARQKIAIALLEKSENTDERLLDRIKLESERLEAMISSLLDYSKLDDLPISQTKKAFDFCQLLQQIVEDSRFEADSKGIKIQTFIKHSHFITGDNLVLQSAIENLLRNAIRYANKNIVIKLDTNDSKTTLIIEDDGRGLPEDELEKIFEAFYRPQVDRSRDSGGVGLGLSIANKAINIHHGKIWAENVNPQGLRLVVELPT